MKKRIGIILPYQNGDLITATSILRYREELWGDADIVWFCNEPHSDALKYQNIEIRNFPHGWGISKEEMKGQYADRIRKDKEDGKPDWEDLSLLMTKDNRLNQELKHTSQSTKDLDEAYFPSPWMLTTEQRHGIEYPNISKKVFGIPDNYEWHPVLEFGDEDYDKVSDFNYELLSSMKVCFETFAGSGQSILNDAQVRKTIQICRDILGECNFVFVSHKYLKAQPEFPEDILADKNNFFCGDFTVRQCALIVNSCDLLISVSSGITVAASCWGNEDFPIIQYTGSKVCSTAAMALGRFELVTHDEKPVNVAEEEFYEKLQLLLNEIK